MGFAWAILVATLATVYDIEGGPLKSHVFDPVDCLGQDLLDYLTDLGFLCEIVSEYLGDEDIDWTILDDENHPDHEDTFEKYFEGSRLCVHMSKDNREITFNWSTGEIVSHSPLPEKVLNDVNDFIDNYGQVRYVRIPEKSEMQDLLQRINQPKRETEEE